MGRKHFDLHTWLVMLMDIVWREPKLILKYYQQPKPRNLAWKGRNVLMVDSRVEHGGMFDCLKGIITIYAISKAMGKDFRIHFVSPFRLEDYLVPNHYDWTIGDDELCYSFPQARPVIAYGELSNPRRLWKKRRGETHFYYGYNSLDLVNEHFGTHNEWSELYDELFKPTEELQSQIDYYKKEVGDDYVVAHFRFLNLLGDKMEKASLNPTLPEQERKVLMERALAQLRRIAEMHPGVRLMLASDSSNFVNYIKKEIPSVYTIPGTIKHVGTAKSASGAEIIKMFLDYYIIGGARKVYSLWTPGMWKSAFPEYAALIGGADFERIEF